MRELDAWVSPVSLQMPSETTEIWVGEQRRLRFAPSLYGNQLSAGFAILQDGEIFPQIGGVIYRERDDGQTRVEVVMKVGSQANMRRLAGLEVQIALPSGVERFGLAGAGLLEDPDTLRAFDAYVDGHLGMSVQLVRLGDNPTPRNVVPSPDVVVRVAARTRRGQPLASYAQP